MIDFVMKQKLDAIRDSRFWERWYIVSEYRERMKPLRKVTGGLNPRVEGWLKYLEERGCI